MIPPPPAINQKFYIHNYDEPPLGYVIKIEKYVGEGWWRVAAGLIDVIQYGSMDVKEQPDGKWFGRNVKDFKYPDKEGVLKRL